jgi:hypothetical protein
MTDKNQDSEEQLNRIKNTTLYEINVT